MAGQDKGLIELAGRPIIEHVLDRLRPQVGEVLISANRNLDRYQQFGHPVISDGQTEYLGPMAGMVAAGRQAHGEWLLIVPCDTPFLPHDLLERLLTEAERSNVRLIRASDGEQIHYTALLLHNSLLPDLERHLGAGRLKLQTWQAEHDARTVAFVEANAFLNINTPDDLKRAEQQQTE